MEVQHMVHATRRATGTIGSYNFEAREQVGGLLPVIWTLHHPGAVVATATGWAGTIDEAEEIAQAIIGVVQGETL